MTIGGTVSALGVLMVLLFGAAAYGWTQVVQVAATETIAGRVVNNNPVIPGWIFGAMIGGLLIGLVTAFVPKIARFTSPIYALCYGVGLGGISAVYNSFYSGIVTQAIFATAAVFAAMLILYTTRVIKVTRRFTTVVMGATMGIMLMYAIAWIASLFGANLFFFREPSPLGILISFGIVVIAALNLAIDFAFIENQTNEGAPKYLEWYAAFGVTVTLVWLYLEILRLLSLLRER